MDDYRDVRENKEARLKAAYKQAHKELNDHYDFAVAYNILNDAVHDFLYEAY